MTDLIQESIGRLKHRERYRVTGGMVMTNVTPILEQLASAIEQAAWDNEHMDSEYPMQHEAKATIQAMIDAGATEEMKIAGSKAVVSAGKDITNAKATDLIEAGYKAMLFEIIKEDV